MTNSRQKLLVEFHQHTTGLDVSDRRTSRPESSVVSVEAICSAPTIPPACASISTAAAYRNIVVAVWSAEHHPVDVIIVMQCRSQRISGVSAVPVDRQLVLTNLITDGERRVFSPVPLTVSALNLHRVVCHVCTVSIIVRPYVLNVYTICLRKKRAKFRRPQFRQAWTNFDTIW